MVYFFSAFFSATFWEAFADSFVTSDFFGGNWSSEESLLISDELYMPFLFWAIGWSSLEDDKLEMLSFLFSWGGAYLIELGLDTEALTYFCDEDNF